MNNKKNTGSAFLLFFLLFISGCSFFNKGRTLTISFHMQEGEGFVPSQQTVIWLEKPDGSFVKTLFVSEYTAYGGYLIPGICPEWVTRANWQHVGQEEFDAVTGSTPQVGKVKMEFKLSDNQIPEGEYNLLVETHLAENYNMLWKGRIRFPGKCRTTMDDLKYIPEKYPKIKSDLITDIQVICK
jgi:hypothetical protein